MKHALIAASLVLVAGTAVGCGGPPTDASVKDFCGNFENLYSDLGDAAGADADTSDMIKTLKDAANEIEDTGTPEDISDDAREGWQLTIDAIQNIDDDATEEDLAKLDSEFSEDEQKKSDAFDEYLSKTCDTP